MRKISLAVRCRNVSEGQGGREIKQGLTIGAALISNGSRKKRKIFQFCSDTTDFGRFGVGSDWNWFN